MHTFSRRKFLALSALGLVGAQAASAVQPFARAGSPRFKLSLAAYSLRQFFKEEKGKAIPGGKLDMLSFIDYCADQGCAGAELTSYYLPNDVSDEYLLNVRRHAFLRGVEISGTAVGNNFALPNGPERDKQIADVKRWIDRAAVLGAPHIRIFAGAAKGVDDIEARKLCVSALEECSDYAGAKGIFLGLENHGGIVAKAEGLLEIVQAVKSPWLGVNLDTGNFHSADPYAELAQCAPYAVNVQIKTEIRRAGAKEPEPADLPKLAQILRDANYQGWVTLEYEAKEDPWTAVPPLLVQLREVLDAPAAKKEAAGWVPLFDGRSLDGWKVTEFSGHGEVTVEGGRLILEQGGDLTGINYARDVPKLNYEVALEAMRLEGSDFFCGLTLPYGKEGFTFVVGGWGGSVVGVSSINSDDASENETTQFRKIENGRWYRIRVRVTGEKIDAWLDDEQVVNVTTEDKRIAMRSGEIEMSQPFGIATFRTRAALRNLRLRGL
ncbi:MAG: Xylose isomerase [Chthoniobacter sp.]|nr:Xylose isomerase [Chthoniobacter sp.]